MKVRFLLKGRVSSVLSKDVSGRIGSVTVEDGDSGSEMRLVRSKE